MKTFIALPLTLLAVHAPAAAAGPPVGRDAAVVTAWNDLANELAFAEERAPVFKPVRAPALMHLAMHDALNAVEPRFAQYAPLATDAAADPIAVAAQAAHDVLAAHYPAARQDLAVALASWLARVPDGEAEARGVALGGRSAAALLGLRRDDGWDVEGTYVFARGAGAYQTTPSWNGFMLQPGFRFAKPLALARPDELRPPAPPPLASAEYAAAYAEVKEHGAHASAARTAEQSGYARWWMEFSETAVNRLARELAGRRGLDAWQAARLFALLNTALHDAYVAVWDAKYEYNLWRPYTAIREAETDGNPATLPDPEWEPLLATPPHPEYPSAHGAGCAATFAVLEHVLGDGVAFTMATRTAPPEMPTRSFPGFRAAAAECADSRVRLGWHFRFATDAGLTLGRAVAERVVRGTLAPR